MEYENKYASNAKGNAALTTGIIGTAGVGLGLLGNMLGGNLFGANAAIASDNMPVNRYEAAQSARIAELETEVKLRDANTYTDGKLLEVYKYFDGKIGHIEHELCEQKVFNATQIGTISCIQGQIAQLQGLTKLVVPNSSICPGWGDVTVSITPASSTTA